MANAGVQERHGGACLLQWRMPWLLPERDSFRRKVTSLNRASPLVTVRLTNQAHTARRAIVLVKPGKTRDLNTPLRGFLPALSEIDSDTKKKSGGIRNRLNSKSEIVPADLASRVSRMQSRVGHHLGSYTEFFGMRGGDACIASSRHPSLVQEE